MTDFLLNAHSGWQYVALAAVIIAVVVAVRGGTDWAGTNTRIYSFSAIAVDIQVLLGIVLWVADSGWSKGALQGWVHPVAGLAALGVIHGFISQARAADNETSNGLMRNGFLIGLLIIVVAIGVAEAA
jgi:hypothetical protein